MKQLFLCFLLALAGSAADNRTVAAHLANLARKAAGSGQTVRAYLLFSEAAARDPQNPTYRVNRDALAPAAKLLTQAKIETANISNDVFSAENEAANPEPPIERISAADWHHDPHLLPLPHVKADPAKHDFDVRSDAKSLVQQVASAYGVHAIADIDLPLGEPIHFELQEADFRTALSAVTAATHTFVFPVSANTVEFAPDTEAKRNELEPVVVLTFPLLEALTEKDLIEAANAVRGLLGIRTVGWDSLNRVVVVRDRMTRANVARNLMEALLLPRAQVSFEVQFLTVDTDETYHYGASLQTLFQLIDFGKIGLQSVLPAALGPTSFLTFGNGATLFGVGVAEATAFANYSNSVSKIIYDANVVVGDRQVANFHVGDQYPIASSIYTGFSQPGGGSIYDPAPQITMENLGLVLKMTPHVNGEGDVDLDLEADFKSIGSQTFNTIPAINERSFKGSVSLREGEWAVIAGLDIRNEAFSRSGLAGIGQIPGLKQLLTETQRESQASNTLIVIRPTVTSLPAATLSGPEFLLGPRRGERVLM